MNVKHGRKTDFVTQDGVMRFGKHLCVSGNVHLKKEVTDFTPQGAQFSQQEAQRISRQSYLRSILMKYYENRFQTLCPNA